MATKRPIIDLLLFRVLLDCFKISTGVAAEFAVWLPSYYLGIGTFVIHAIFEWPAKLVMFEIKTFNRKGEVNYLYGH